MAPGPVSPGERGTPGQALGPWLAPSGPGVTGPSLRAQRWRIWPGSPAPRSFPLPWAGAQPGPRRLPGAGSPYPDRGPASPAALPASPGIPSGVFSSKARLSRHRPAAWCPPAQEGSNRSFGDYFCLFVLAAIRIVGTILCKCVLLSPLCCSFVNLEAFCKHRDTALYTCAGTNPKWN